MAIQEKLERKLYDNLGYESKLEKMIKTKDG